LRGRQPDRQRQQLVDLQRLGSSLDPDGVDSVKVGIEPGPAASDVLRRLAACGRPVVPVFIADRGLDFALVREAAALGFAALMADTADKRAGSLFDAVAHASLCAFVSCVREAGVMVGLAGALRAAHADALTALAPDFAGFRSAVTDGDRAGKLDAARLRALRAKLVSAHASTHRRGRAAEQQRAHPRQVGAVDHVDREA
jgi:hypothetical protein